MKAYVLGENGPVIADVPQPQATGTQVLVRIRAACLNRADLGMAKGRAHGTRGGTGSILGGEGAGEVVAIGPGVKGVKVGDRVMGSINGAFAEFGLMDHGRVFAIPANNMSYEQAATLPVALNTMHNAVVTAGALKSGQTVLIQGASSGVGLMAMQIAKLKGASLVIGTSTDSGRRARLNDYGADLAINTLDSNWVDQVLEATNGDGVDMIVDQVSGVVANGNLRATKIEGRIVNVGRLGGMIGEFDFDLHALRRINYIGVTFRTRTIDEIRAITAAVKDDIWDSVVSGKLALPIDKVFSLDQADDAYAHMEENRHFGKIVLRT
ncbi:quinone oxidoreductase [Afipia sp. P52-10]|uniref:zinc-binding dehydrogenase n=1 Tax=Afipia sp. P52-10 TaxID=1429916 RepID=UPI0003DF2515|nr:zinc-binding dehydrogenase [Afipia sp. P52-10]ETR74726.1 quinone oxidoreductase [Afipia sp. P52-10]